MSSDNPEYVEIAGERFALGLNLPEDGIRPMTFEPLPDSFLLTKKQIETIVGNPQRTPRRELFAGPQWIWSQGGVGSCCPQTFAGAVMRARQRRNLRYVKLSGSGLYSRVNRSVDNGASLEEVRRVVENEGVPIADGLKDNEFYRGKNSLPEKNVKSMKRFKAKAYRIDHEDQLASGLASGEMFAVVAVHVDKLGRYKNLDSDGVRGGGGGFGNHCTGCCDVRIRKGIFEFDEFGSWGLRNGVDGYAWVQWDRHLKGPNERHAFCLIHTVIDDPEDPDRIVTK